MCLYWRELDDSRGLFEFCRKVKGTTNCCGDIKRCCYKNFVDEKDLRTQRARDLANARIELELGL